MIPVLNKYHHNSLTQVTYSFHDNLLLLPLNIDLMSQYIKIFNKWMGFMMSIHDQV